MTTYAVTGATGKLGQLVLDELLTQTDAGNVVALARDPAKLAKYDQLGVQVRQADYDDAGSLAAALEGVDRLLLISGNAVGQRERQHGAVVEAAKQAGVEYLAYTSILKGDTSRLQLAPEHVATERLLKDSGMKHDVLRNGWYSENYTGGLAQNLASGKVFAATGEGRLSTASRQDLAAGAAAALIKGEGGHTYELAGDESWTMREFAEEVSRQSGQPVEFVNQSEADYAKTLEGAGLPPPVASMLANTSALSGEGELHDDRRDLSRLSGRPTTPIRETIAAALKG